MVQGHPLNALDSNYEVIFSIIRKALFGVEPVLPADADYEAVFQELLCQAIIPVSANVYRELPLPEGLFARWKAAVIQFAANGLHVQNVEQQVSALFLENGIPSAILKGSSAAMYYPGDLLRTYGDVDVIVNPRDFEKAAGLLTDNGFRQVNGLYDDYRNVTFSYYNVKLELHRHFFEKKDCRYDSILYDALQHCVKREKPEQFFLSLPDPENGIVLLQHIRQHIVGALGLRQIIDWVMFVSKVCDDDFWNKEFRSRAAELGLETLAMVAARLGKLYFGLPDTITWCDSASTEAVDAMLSYLIDNGNFGVKQLDTKRNVLNIAGRNRSLFGWCKYLQYTGEKNWKFLLRHPQFRCFAWLYQIIRYIYNGISSGEVFAFFRKKQWKEAKQKRRLYSMLGIE